MVWYEQQWRNGKQKMLRVIALKISNRRIVYICMYIYTYVYLYIYYIGIGNIYLIRMWRQSILHHFLATRNFWSLTDVKLRYIISVYFFIPSFYILSSRSLKGEFASLFALRILEEPTKPKFDVATKIAR